MSSHSVTPNVSTDNDSSNDHVFQKETSVPRQPLVLLPPKSYPQWHNSVAGAVAGASARVATAPLDLIRIRAQLERDVTYPRPSFIQKLYTIYQQEGGFLALFRGNAAATYLWIGYSMVQFSVYTNIKQRLTQIQQRQQQNQVLTPTVVSFVSGASAGFCATVSTYPFDICRTVFAAQGLSVGGSTSTSRAAASASFQPPKTVLECATRMYQQPNGRGGIAAFFVGVKPAVVQIIPYMGLNFAIYDHLTQGDRRVGLSGYAGSISGAVSKIIVYPCDTVKKRIQYQSVFGSTIARSPTTDAAVRQPHYYTDMWDCLITMIRTEGVRSLYRGLVPSVLKTTIGSGLSFTFFRMTKNALEELHDHYHSDNSSGRSHTTSDKSFGITA